MVLFPLKGVKAAGLGGVLLSGALLSGCGGGGSGPSRNNPQPTPLPATNGRIFFSSDRPSGTGATANLEIYSSLPNGSDVRALTADTPPATQAGDTSCTPTPRKSPATRRPIPTVG